MREIDAASAASVRSVRSADGLGHEPADVIGKPVFVDQRGRRRRWMAWWGLMVAAVCVMYVAVLVASLAADPVRPGDGDRAGSTGVPAVEMTPRPAEVGVPR